MHGKIDDYTLTKEEEARLIIMRELAKFPTFSSAKLKARRTKKTLPSQAFFAIFFSAALF